MLQIIIIQIYESEGCWWGHRCVCMCLFCVLALDVKRGCTNRKKCFFSFHSLRLSLNFAFSRNDTTKEVWERKKRQLWSGLRHQDTSEFFFVKQKTLSAKNGSNNGSQKICNSAGFFLLLFLKCVAEALASIVFVDLVYDMVKAIRRKISCMGVHRRRSALTDYKYHLLAFISESVVYTNTKQHTSETHAAQRKSHLCRCRCRRCELFCLDKIVPLVCSTFIPKCMLHTVSQCPAHLSRRLWLLFHVCCVHMGRRLRLRTRSTEWDGFFLRSFWIAIERYTAFVLHEK